MATQEITAPPAVPQVVAHNVERERTGWTSWVTTTDHKRIGIMYLVLTFVFFLLGGTEALLIRLQLSQADNTLLTPQTYNELITMHGTTMVFLFVVPVMAGFANYFLPLMIGARDMAFPKLNALSFWLLAAGGLVFYGSIFFSPPECGWTCYPPLSSSDYLPSGGVDAWIYLVHLTGLSSLIGAVNFYVTIANMRAPGMGWGRLPLFVWAILIYAILLILALPVIAAAFLVVLLVAVGVYIVSFFLMQALSRYREFAADRGAAVITGRPSALASALLKISGTMERIPQTDLRAHAEMNAFYIFPANAKKSLFNLFSTHPPMEKRIAALERLEAQLQGTGR